MSPVSWLRLGIEGSREVTSAMDYLWWHAGGDRPNEQSPLPTDAYVDVYEAEGGDVLALYRWAPRRFHNIIRNYADEIKELRDRGTIKISLNHKNLLQGFLYFLRANESDDSLDPTTLRFIDIITALSQDRHRYSSSLEELNKAAKRFGPASFARSLRAVVERHEGLEALTSNKGRSLHHVLANWVTNVAENPGAEFKPNNMVGALFALSDRGEGRLVERLLSIFQRMEAIERGVETRMQRGRLARIPINGVYRPALETFVYVVASSDELTAGRRELVQTALRVFENHDINVLGPGTDTYDERRLDIFMLLTVLLSYPQISEQAERGVVALIDRMFEGKDGYETVSTTLRELLPQRTRRGEAGRSRLRPARRRQSGAVRRYAPRFGNSRRGLAAFRTRGQAHRL